MILSFITFKGGEKLNKKLLIILGIILIVFLFSSCLPNLTTEKLLIKMISQARSYVNPLFPSYDLELFEVKALPSNDGTATKVEDFDTWVFSFCDLEQEEGVVATYTNNQWTNTNFEGIWVEDLVIPEGLFITYDVQDAINLINNKNQNSQFYAFIFHIPMDYLLKDYKDPEYKFKLVEGPMGPGTFALVGSVEGYVNFTGF